ncbi:hypothetical protein ONZ45_g4090 [Pleurotus djamor]|nr:hypothetical protein ONZ45_g4090 [Pleurotus djamor]
MDFPTWSEEVCESFVLSVLKSNLNIAHDLGLQDDIFHIGCDSLQAQHIVKRLSAAVAKSAKLTSTSAPPIPNSFPYHHPTPASMIRALCQLQALEKADGDITPQSLLQSLLPDPSINLAVPHELVAAPHPETVLITGTTGSLGSAMLSQLMSLPNVEKIFTLNRGNPDALVERQSRTFETYGFVPIQNDQKVEHLVGDMNAPNWGIEQQTFEQIRRNVTLIIHNAWPVNFNMVLNSFIPSITAVRSLAEFAATKASLRPRVLFISSIAASRVDQTQSTPSSSTTRFGYAESKWVAERVLEAFLPDPERLSILRIGQICGGANGVWNHKEWFPALIQASCAIGALPTFEDTRIAWIPLDSVASTIIDSAFRLWTKETRCLLVQHQSPITWETLNSFLLSELGKGISLVPFETWVERLEKSPSADLGASVLLEFFKAHQASYEAFIDAASGRLESGVPPLSQEDVRRWVEHWKKIKFLSN